MKAFGADAPLHSQKKVDLLIGHILAILIGQQQLLQQGGIAEPTSLQLLLGGSLRL
jgi:hypothetical protein